MSASEHIYFLLYKLLIIIIFKTPGSIDLGVTNKLKAKCWSGLARNISLSKAVMGKDRVETLNRSSNTLKRYFVAKVSKESSGGRNHGTRGFHCNRLKEMRLEQVCILS